MVIFIWDSLLRRDQFLLSGHSTNFRGDIAFHLTV